jgi:hypothetical protein
MSQGITDAKTQDQGWSDMSLGLGNPPYTRLVTVFSTKGSYPSWLEGGGGV